MKKFISCLLCALLMLTLPVGVGAMGNSGEKVSTAGTLEYPAPGIDEILAGTSDFGNIEAIHTPTLDGEIAKGEYQEMDLIEAAYYMGVFAYDTYYDDADMQAFATVADTLISYWGSGWDGTYLYMAFEVNTEDIDFYNGLTQDNVYLFANTCFQIGVAAPGASGNNYSETGYGISTAAGYEGKPITFSWQGHFTPVSGEDFACSWDKDEDKAVYEMRINLGEALGYTAESGSQIKITWAYMIGEGASNTASSHALMFSHGITGRYSYKECSIFTAMTLTGDPENVGEVIELTEEEKLEREYGIKETNDFSKEAVQKEFISMDGAITGEAVTEGDCTFMRYTSTAEDAMLVNTVYPKSVNADLTKYIAIRYRTSSPTMEELGIAYRNTYNGAEYDDTSYYDIVYADGQWRTLIFNMSGESAWTVFPSELALLLDEGTIDIQWIKYFTQDVYELYWVEEPDEQATEPVTDDVDTSTDTSITPDDTTAGSEPVTGEGTETAIATQSATQPGDAVSEGCGSVLTASILPALSLLCGGAWLAMRRHRKE